jgi:hypothetical protein
MNPNTTRTYIRLKHSLPAGEEIHDVLPAKLDEFEKALARLGATHESNASTRCAASAQPTSSSWLSDSERVSREG